MKGDKYMLILARYIESVFQDFESFLRTEIDVVENDIRLVLDEYSSSFVTYDLGLGIYTFKDFSNALFNNLQPEYKLYNNSVDIEYDYIAMETSLTVRLGIIAISLDEKSFSCNVLGFSSVWDYKHYNEYTRKL